MSKSAAILGLVAIASAGAPAAYGSSAAPAYSSAAPVYSSAYDPSWSSAAPVYSSSAAPYDPSSSGWSSAPAYPSASSSWVVSAYPSSSSIVPSSTPTPVCWSTCFASAGISSESQLCGNTVVDECIHDGCSCEESWAYWQWYDSYCAVASSSSSVYVYPSSTISSVVYSATPSSPIDQCWSACFAKYDVTSEAELCGDDDVSQCIHDTCCAAEDKAYWAWYDGFCAAASTGVVTYTTLYTPTASGASPVTTTYEETQTYAWTPVASPTGTTLPAPPASPIAPYTTYPAATSAVAGATGYGTATAAAAPTGSAWAPVPATGAGAVAKPGMLFAAVMAVAALF